jgi:hypothetical protein|tara:strand:- start:5384 stop:5539 length:156 start_codon:yes stop_codon:yes gene_type:complete
MGRDFLSLKWAMEDQKHLSNPEKIVRLFTGVIITSLLFPLVLHTKPWEKKQ